MDKYICTLCDKNLETRQRFWKHKNRKNPCVTDKIILKKIDYDLTIKVIEEKDKKIKENEKEIRFLKEKLELLNVIHEQRNQIENKYK
jgi:protein associated with RNAse G/E